MRQRAFSGVVFWTVIGGFLIGVFVRSVFQIPFVFVVFSLVLGIACVMLSLLMREQQRLGVLVAIALISTALGIERMNVSTLSGDPLLSQHLDERIAIEGDVVGEPDVREGSVRLSVAAHHMALKNATSSVSVGVLVVVPAHTTVAYGDHVVAVGTLRAPEAFDTGEGRQFAYPEYLAMQGIEYELSAAVLESREPHLGNPLSAFAISTKHLFLNGLSSALSEPAAGFGGGITVGDKRSIGQSLSADFQKVGLIHMIVLSGYNITVVLNAAAKSLARIPLLKSVRFAPFAASGIIVALFVLMSGGASSAARAGLMALIGVYARMSGRLFLASRALATAAMALVLYNPFVLVFDPGFQLSMLATLGLIVFTPLFATRLNWIPERFALREIASSTLGTQTAVLPLLLYQNGQFPLYALPANLLTLPFVPFAMLLSLIAGIAGIFLGPLAVVIGFPAYIILQYIVSIASVIAHLPYASISIGAFGPVWMFVAYAFLFIIAAHAHKKKAAEHAPSRFSGAR